MYLDIHVQLEYCVKSEQFVIQETQQVQKKQQQKTSDTLLQRKVGSQTEPKP